MKNHLVEQGFALVENIYSAEEIQEILTVIEKKSAEGENEHFRKQQDLFAIRNFLGECPELVPLIFTKNFEKLIEDHTNEKENYFVVKSIYFDKPPLSNWYVIWHQDLMIQVNQKEELEGFSAWTCKKGEYAVLPPQNILENIITLRIHLDDTTRDNGALKVIPQSHQLGIIKKDEVNLNYERAVICECNQGAVMLMKPLLFHASDKTINEERRRVIHIEMASMELLNNLDWRERL
ncbi:MAG: phytanoyl-CoA dioxygenase family protein [Cytophagales bacterium]|nr:phytanoyl-CoA dioxygenase family protein [Cytophagales bacterium]